MEVFEGISCHYVTMFVEVPVFLLKWLCPRNTLCVKRVLTKWIVFRLIGEYKKSYRLSSREPVAKTKL